MEIITTTEKPRGICGVIAAVEGFGKTTLAAHLPRPLFIDTDRGCDGIEVHRVRFDGKLGEFKGLVEEFRHTAPGEYRTIVIDTADALEAQLTADFCKAHNWQSMEEEKFGRCWNMYKPEFAGILDDLKDLAKKCGWNVFFTAHVQVREYADPLRADKYNRIQLKLAPSTSMLLKEWADLYMTGLFVTDVFVDQVGRKEIHHAERGRRMCYLEHNEKYDAKCRACIQLPGGTPFPKEVGLDEMAKILPEALEYSTLRGAEPAEVREAEPANQDRPASQDKPKRTAKPKAEPKPEPKPEPQPEPEPEKPSVNEAARRLFDAMRQFGISEKEMVNYLEARGKFGTPLPWKLQEIPAPCADWILHGIDKIAAKVKAAR